MAIKAGFLFNAMTQEQIEISQALFKYTYLPGSFEKRFASSMRAISETNPHYELTEKQKGQLYRQLKRYRRQIPKTFEKYGRLDKTT